MNPDIVRYKVRMLVSTGIACDGLTMSIETIATERERIVEARTAKDAAFQASLLEEQAAWTSVSRVLEVVPVNWEEVT